MHVSEAFPKFIASVLLVVLAVAVIIGVSSWLPPNHVQAQNAGNVGIYTKEVTAFTVQASSASSAIFPDFGFGANYLSYCTVGFSGTINLEWEPPGTSIYIPLAQATYGSGTPDTACRSGTAGLQIGGYYPNLRSTVIMSAGTISAWYTASAAPISAFPPAYGSNGSSSPISCDQNAAASVNNSTTVALLGSSSAATTILCGFTISYNGATSAGNDEVVWSLSTACTATVGGWDAFTTSGTPQTLFIGQTLRSPAGPYSVSHIQTPCFVNNSGATAFVSLNYAEVPNL